MHNKDKPLFNDDCRRAFDLKQEAYLRWTRDRSRVNWDEFVYYQRRANAAYPEPGRQYSVGSRDVLMNAQSDHKWWSTPKSAVFGSNSDLSPPPLTVGLVVVWSVSRLGRQKCSRPILMDSSSGIL